MRECFPSYFHSCRHKTGLLSSESYLTKDMQTLLNNYVIMMSGTNYPKVSVESHNLVLSYFYSYWLSEFIMTLQQ